MDIVAQIEVINGPSASEGIGAAGGIINYISKSPDQGWQRGHAAHKIFRAGLRRQHGL
jgi:outer membrane receptor for ferrienterochelin and colicin